MAKLFIAAILLFLTFDVIAEQQQISSESRSINPSTSTEQLAQRGCCSHHGGVCGCSGGTAMCCDGNPSPSCGCHANDIEKFLKTNEAEQPKS